MRLEYQLKGRTLSIYRNRKMFTSGTVYNRAHVKAIEKKFEAWASMGWPYIPEDERPMKFPVGTTLALLPGGNKYKVRELAPTKGSEYRGCYLLECVDFWCSEDLGDAIYCHKEGQKLWIASYHVDCQMQVETSSLYKDM